MVRFVYINHYVCLDSIKKFYFVNLFNLERAERVARRENKS